MLPFQTSALEDVFVCACPRNSGARSFQLCPLRTPSCCGAAIASLPCPPALSPGGLAGSIPGLCFPAPSGQQHLAVTQTGAGQSRSLRGIKVLARHMSAQQSAGTRMRCFWLLARACTSMACEARCPNPAGEQIHPSGALCASPVLLPESQETFCNICSQSQTWQHILDNATEQCSASCVLVWPSPSLNKLAL